MTYLTIERHPVRVERVMADRYELRWLRLKELAEHIGRGAQSEISRRSGIRANYLNRMLSDTSNPGHKRIGEAVAERIERGMDLEPGTLSSPNKIFFKEKYLIHRAAPQKLPQVAEKSSTVANVSPGTGLRSRVPLISWAAAGRFRGISELLQRGQAFNWLPTIMAPVQAHTFALRVEGDSMTPDFAPGMAIIVEPDLDPLPGDFVVVKQDDAATLKQLVQDGAEHLLRPLNDRYPIRPLGDGQIIGVVRASSRTYR